MRFAICPTSGCRCARSSVTKYHVRVHYRTGKKATRRVSWFTNIKADSETEAGNKAIQRVVNRKVNTGAVEVETVEVREQRPPATGERAAIVKWLGKHGYRQLADAVERGEHLK